MTVTYKIPATEGGDGTYVLLTTSIPDDDVATLLSPENKDVRGSSLDYKEHDESSLTEQPNSSARARV